MNTFGIARNSIYDNKRHMQLKLGLAHGLLW
jgi:hypothetical protein